MWFVNPLEGNVEQLSSWLMMFHLGFGVLEGYSSCSRCPRQVRNGGGCLGLSDASFPEACSLRKEHLRAACRG